MFSNFRIFLFQDGNEDRRHQPFSLAFGKERTPPRQKFSDFGKDFVFDVFICEFLNDFFLCFCLDLYDGESIDFRIEEAGYLAFET